MRPIAMSCASGAASWVAGVRARISARLAAVTTSTIAEMNPAMTNTSLSDRARVSDLDMAQLSDCEVTIERFEYERPLSEGRREIYGSLWWRVITTRGDWQGDWL